MSVEVRRANGDGETEAAIRLRHRVFCEEQGVPESDEVDGRDGEGVHLVAVDENGRVVATCRLVFVGSTVQLSRLAVDVSHRRQGIASRLLRTADAAVRERGARRVVLHAQTYARDLYLSHGYRPRGPIFVEAGIEHVA
ncbi:MAG TPA: GNAT family N-acetyltransferase, partial [Solirubrobacteraceae bacterium]